MRLAVLVLLVAGGVRSSSEGEEVEEVTMSDQEAHSKTIKIKDFDEGKNDGRTFSKAKHYPLDSSDDRVIHFTMAPDHDCRNGICTDGDFMLTDIPEFAEVVVSCWSFVSSILFFLVIS